MVFEDTLRRLTRSRAELEDALRLDATRLVGDCVLELIEPLDVRADRVEVVVRREVELAHRNSISDRTATKKRPEVGRLRARLIRRRPTLPGGCPPSTIGAGGLNYSVRNGKRCTPAAMTAETCWESRARL